MRWARFGAGANSVAPRVVHQCEAGWHAEPKLASAARLRPVGSGLFRRPGPCIIPASVLIPKF
jgi:hypothetical protein